MKLEIKIPELRCNEETDGLGDDEILLFAAAVPVDTETGDRFWRYADRWTDADSKYRGNVDTGETHRFLTSRGFPDPIVFTPEVLEGRAVEIWVVIAENDGDRSQPYEAYEALRTQLAERCTPGTIVGNRGDLRGSGSDWDRLLPAGNDVMQVLGEDVFTINLAQPVAGAIDPGYELGGVMVTCPQRADAVYQNERDGWMSETRSYRHEGQDSRYTIDIEYRLID